MPAVHTVPPWVLLAAQAGEDADLEPDVSSPVPASAVRPRAPREASGGSSSNSPILTSPHRVSLIPSAQKHEPSFAIPRTDSPEPEDGLVPEPAPPPPASDAHGSRAVGDPSSAQPTPQPRSSSGPPGQASSGPHHVRQRLHRLCQRLSEYHAADDPDAVSEDFDPQFEDISDDEIHEQRAPLRGRRAQGVYSAASARRMERSRSLEQSRFTWDKDEWLTATLRMSPAERRRLGHEIRSALANSGSYWAKRRQRRKLRQQMRAGGGASDPNDSFQPMNLAIEAAQTFGTRDFTGHDPPRYKSPRSPDLVPPVQTPDAPWQRHHRHSLSSTTPYPSADVGGARSHYPRDTSSRRSADHSQAHLARMSGLHLQMSADEGEQELIHERFSEKDVYTRRQASDDRWNSPWQPQMNAGLSRSDTGWSTADNGGFRLPWFQRRGEDDTGFGYGYGQKKKSRARMASWSWWHGFLLHNPFAPLFVRTINLVITTSTLAVAIRERQSLRTEGVEEIVGISPLLGIIFAPLTLAHIFFQVWLEYFGRPIGLWSVRSKLLGTSIEIVFVGMWSAEMALAWDNYYTTPNHDIPIHRRGYIRRLQCFLIGLSFISLFAYMITLTLSLFRIFVRVSAVGRSEGH